MFVFAEIAQRKLNTIKLFINGVETIQEIPKLERLRRLQSYEALLDSCNISNMVKK